VEECLQKYGGLVWSIARKLLPNHADAEDAVQEVFIEIWRHANRFDPRVSSESTYITTIARRRLIDHFRRRSREPQMDPIEEEMANSISRQEQQTEIEEEALRARQYMQQLRPEQQKVLELSITHGLSQSQIAKTIDLPLGTVKTHTRRGLLRLRELLDVDQVDAFKRDTV